MAQNISLWGATYSAVPALTVPTSGSGTARFTDTSPTTATDSDVANGKVYFKADGTQSTGTASGGATGVAKGTVTYASAVNTSTSTKITDPSEIGFTPTAFMFFRDDRSATTNHLQMATYAQIGSSYHIRTKTLYGSNGFTTSGDANNWTTRTGGYLYFTSNGIYYRSSSTSILPAGTFHWVAYQ